MFSGKIAHVTCPRIAVLGTDGAIGKRTTATVLTRALNEFGIKAAMVSTGQTGLIQGARYGIALDAIPSQFCSGEMEATMVDAFETEAVERMMHRAPLRVEHTGLQADEDANFHGRKRPCDRLADARAYSAAA